MTDFKFFADLKNLQISEEKWTEVDFNHFEDAESLNKISYLLSLGVSGTLMIHPRSGKAIVRFEKNDEYYQASSKYHEDVFHKQTNGIYRKLKSEIQKMKMKG